MPSLNEAQRLPDTLTRTVAYLEAQPYSSSIVVIDNGSVDRTVDVARNTPSSRVPVGVIGCAQRGKGAAVRRGIDTSRARFVGYMDADLATPIETLNVVMPLLEAGSQAVVGTRSMHGLLARRQPFRSAGALVFRAMAATLLHGIADTQCGFKFFAGDLVRAVARHLTIDGFAFDVELLCAITRQGIPVTEISVEWSDQEGSTLRLLSDGRRALADLLKLIRPTSASAH
jgi:glycosyltransferase involved in cell wall biosynthesis